MGIVRQEVCDDDFNPNPGFSYALRKGDFAIAMQDVYDFFGDVNERLAEKGLGRLEDMMLRASLSGMLSDMLTASLAAHARTLTRNIYPNGHPDLIRKGTYPDDSVKSGDAGVEIKTTVKRGGAVDAHGARNQWLCVFVYKVDTVTQPLVARELLRFTEVYLAQVQEDDFRKNERGALGTRTATLHKDGLKKLRSGWIYCEEDAGVPRRSREGA
ncbi:hypothetical protein [Candidatus Poriferisodalis sp.]|uniref:hypothetical protein n=1 Tax=Candidatus Poriferisodalis sp. TaxID=3101277 RepID=UPI003D0C115E